ncbi:MULTISPECIES: alpha/beta hydrolase [Actinoplanes]|uniref:alpha/beta fold hydrolase n=1 Tax=Actinoplanes TaxID=1865 RepID=UPI0005F2BC3D|nr:MULTISPECIES: alpha/beta hydrolase [Actinoplanes]GLY01651.1 alpha/beta hydrolase [Actinoplanes sp. NBRC 101535]
MIEHSAVVMTDGVRLHVETSGPVDAAATVILLHGWCQDRRTWEHQVSALAGLGRKAPRVVAFDIRGHGRSDATDIGSATLDRLGDDLAEVIARYAPEGPLVLAGHSMGGMAVMEYAHRRPEEFATRVAGLLLVSTTAEGHAHTRYGLPPQVATLLRAGETLGAGLLARSGAWRPHRAVLPVLRPALRWLLFGDECAETAMLTTMRGFGRAPLNSIGGFRAAVGAQQRLDTLAAIGPVPSVVLVGDRDRLTPRACAESIAGALPDAELTVLAGAGHMLPLERPEAVADALTGIVRRVLRDVKRARKNEVRRMSAATRCRRAA